jgi:hypothetical protein
VIPSFVGVGELESVNSFGGFKQTFLHLAEKLFQLVDSMINHDFVVPIGLTFPDFLDCIGPKHKHRNESQN